MRLVRFAKEFWLMRRIGLPLRMCVAGGWRRSHPQARERFAEWIRSLPDEPAPRSSGRRKRDAPQP